MAKILLSIYPEYTKTIFSGIKTAEFCRKVVNELLEGGNHTLYFYETKKLSLIHIYNKTEQRRETQNANIYPTGRFCQI